MSFLRRGEKCFENFLGSLFIAGDIVLTGISGGGGRGKTRKFLRVLRGFLKNH